ncbi:GyrI-like domain-containing protein [Amycolatopsis sp. PS_44_ISF1]|uniref:GyrI-like domain-containing protein n=1 Tax=Amycolatopsis sp. PS_44_ISF1 TaxID=2974917 RepID=UPI0028DD9898|nr:GyrI-like domain-containing protein [Amycolatopsis sp. PS_44_ISF1]MDT8912772.1 GyrI-like domain-containing protein [Amycolatopsis sp. PS_44_ISF1]
MPSFVDRPAQRYAGFRDTVTAEGLPEVAHRIGAIVGALAQRGVTPAGAPFFRYLSVGARLTVEAGVPTEGPVDLGEEYFTDVVPGGRYATSTHHGAPDGLHAATAALLEWGERQGVRWDRAETPDGERWGARLEVYRTDPREEPDAAKWETDLCFRLAG